MATGVSWASRPMAREGRGCLKGGSSSSDSPPRRNSFSASISSYCSALTQPDSANGRHMVFPALRLPARSSRADSATCLDWRAGRATTDNDIPIAAPQYWIRASRRCSNDAICVQHRSRNVLFTSALSAAMMSGCFSPAFWPLGRRNTCADPGSL
jgi:hypothetical protein